MGRVRRGDEDAAGHDGRGANHGFHHDERARGSGLDAVLERQAESLRL